MSSILRDVKYTLGVDPDDRTFDVELCLHINSALAIIQQIGLPIEPRVSDDTIEWEMLYVGTHLDNVREIVANHVKLVFDPPQLSFVTTSLKNVLEECKTRLAYSLEVQ